MNHVIYFKRSYLLLYNYYPYSSINNFSLPITSECRAEKKSQKAVSTSNPVIRVSDTGFLQSFDTLGRALVLVTGIDNNGLKQTLTLVVEVSKLRYYF